ncbi:MAG: diphosphate--fructose-6-phosphate 1-phosphotransferase [Caldilineaceae bacterium]|nr:diphosphate--fructose-6-phosphate 1-phosphotransferase [Caldilineaceae bacterium]
MNVLVLQSGGPTPVFNASLWGVIDGCRVEPKVKRLFGARQGIQGLSRGDWVELTHFENRFPPYLDTQPGAALGCGRQRLDADQIPLILERLAHHEIGAVIIIGGNGSMAAGQLLGAGAAAKGYPLQVVGVPKTVDNDLVGTDFAPGYGSAARFIAQTVRDISLDLYAMRNFDDVAVVEVMGRHTGWLAAASALARRTDASPPHLILMPEVLFDEGVFLDRVRAECGDGGVCMVVAAEGIQDQTGNFLADLGRGADQVMAQDATGQKLLSFAAGVAPYLAGRIQSQLGLRCRQVRPDTIQRASSSLVSELDRRQAARTGAAAVDAVAEGLSQVMVGLHRHTSGWLTEPVPFADIVGQEKRLPPEFIAESGFDVTQAFMEYAVPLVDRIHTGIVLF